ncbi:MAG: hypothetical protein HPY75_08160 [Actinobacteria bacterium]|nr:hypothetical protein [Actinomycetota bacterium]
MAKKLDGATRFAAQASLTLLALGALAVPPAAVASSGTAGIDATWTALRIMGLYALTLLFLNVATGSFRPLLNGVFKPKLLFRLHNSTGLVGFSMAVAHMILVIAFGIGRVSASSDRLRFTSSPPPPWPFC